MTVRDARAAHRLVKQRRLRTRREYLAAQRHAERRKIHGTYFLVIVAPARQASPATTRGPADTAVGTWGRVGITVSKKVGNAVVRNRIKRWVREFVRRNLEWLPAGRDVVVIARQRARELTHQSAVDRDLGGLRKRLERC